MRFFACCLLQIVSLSLGLAITQAADRPLNLLYITADDMNWDSSGWMGNKTGAAPTLDALAVLS